MNWTAIATVAVPVVVAILGLIGIVVTARKTHHAALAQANAAKKQANAAQIQAESALAAARASAKTAEATAEAAIQDAFTRAYEAASTNWARSQEGLQKWCEAQSSDLGRLSERQARTEMALEAEKVRANKYEHLYALAIVYLHRVFGWVAEHVPGEGLPPPPPELESDLWLGGQRG